MAKLTGLLLLFGLAALVSGCESNINQMEEIQRLVTPFVPQ
jgi:hypothetical protein